MNRVPKQALLPFGRKERFVNRQIAEKMAKRSRRAVATSRKTLGRPPTGTDAMSHQRRAQLPSQSAVHVTLRLSKKAPNLRNRRKFALIKRAFAAITRANSRDASGAAPADTGRHAQSQPDFRLVHYAVLGDHIHLLCEVDSAASLAKGIQRISISIARLLNNEGVRTCGGSLQRNGIPLRERAGWIGKIFHDRYHVHHLGSPSEIASALNYIMWNALKHYGTFEGSPCEIRTAGGRLQKVRVDFFTSFAQQHQAPAPWKPFASGYLLKRAMQKQSWVPPKERQRA